MASVVHRHGPGKGDWYVYGPWGKKDYSGTASLTRNGFRDLLAKELWGDDPKQYPDKDYRKAAVGVFSYSWIDGRWVKDSHLGPFL
jgi:hypothetical protein